MKNKILIAISIFIGKYFIYTIFNLNKKILLNENILTDLVKKRIPIVICCWHGRLIFPLYFLRKRGYYGVAGLHGDAEIAKRIGEKMGWKFIRGSSTRGGKEAYNKMYNIIKIENAIIAITPDGPRGPEFKAKPGAIKTGIKTEAALLPICGQASNRWEIKSWDTFIVPKPFGKIIFNIGEPIFFSQNTQFDTATIELENKMNILLKETDDFAEE